MKLNNVIDLYAYERFLPKGETLSLERVKEYLQIDGTDFDGILEDMLDGAIDVCENYTSLTFGSQEMIQQYYGPIKSGERIPMFGGRVISIDEVLIDGILIDSDLYRTQGAKNTYNITIDRSVRAGELLEIKSTMGYGSAADIPRSIAQAILLVVANWFENRGDIAQESMNIPISAKKILDPYSKNLWF